MAVTSALVMFAMIWSLVFFIALPLNLTTQGDVGKIVPGTHASSPEGLKLRRKFLVTTIIALAIWITACAVILSGVFTVRDIDFFNRMDPPGFNRTGAPDSADGTGG